MFGQNLLNRFVILNLNALAIAYCTLYFNIMEYMLENYMLKYISDFSTSINNQHC